MEEKRFTEGDIMDLFLRALKILEQGRIEDENPLLNESKTAQILGLSKGTLTVWRHQGKGPRYVKLGGAIRYKLRDLTEYIKAHRI